MGYKSVLSKIMLSNLDSSTTEIGDPYKCKQDHHVACATERNVHTVFLIWKTYSHSLFPNLIKILLQLSFSCPDAF